MSSGSCLAVEHCALKQSDVFAKGKELSYWKSGNSDIRSSRGGREEDERAAIRGKISRESTS
jgi:hypothetical protein